MSAIAVTFEIPPPARGHKETGLLGPGLVLVEADAVRIVGRRPRAWLARGLGFVAGTAVIVLAAWVLTVLRLERWISGRVALAIGLVFWLLPWFAVTEFLKRRLPGIPVEARLPRACVKLAQRHQTGLVIELAAAPLVGRCDARPVRATDLAVLAHQLERTGDVTGQIRQ